MTFIKRLIVAGLENVCTHRWPFYCRPAGLSAKLDDRWNTGRWKRISGEEEL